MKRVMQQFVDRTTQRFHEYDERMKNTRQKCKDKCDKEIQKIILKDKLEKELMDKFATLHTDIQSDAIPACVCEKSLADKVEKTCLKCGGVLGGGVTPAWGLLSGIVYTGWKAAALAAAKSSAIAEGLAAGKIAGDIAGATKVVELIKSHFDIHCIVNEALESFITAQKYNKVALISDFIYTEYSSCLPSVTFPVAGRPPVFVPGARYPFCSTFNKLYLGQVKSLDLGSLQVSIQKDVAKIVAQGTKAADAKTAEVSSRIAADITTKQTTAINATYASCQTVIIASIVAILVIVLIMVIIYLILRYRRKKKMKKKLQYIKLLEE
ncbi:hypothetical protein PFNF135_05468 [Plasmodium falciparum NF135/5.C10]|uniref:Surface antigen n=1 Tax=Plasmodium falciparum NF135/5.C10 TaxID=1036726 RepID=W4I9V6_PLAFA|nr:hypothetical protein PFNF135_05468 [Plasmodium falciparum NF135/5.C10]